MARFDIGQCASMCFVIVQCTISVSTNVILDAEWSQCSLLESKMVTFKDVSVQTCAKECGSKQDCFLFNYFTRGKFCELLDNNLWRLGDGTHTRPCLRGLRSNLVTNHVCTSAEAGNCNVKVCPVPTLSNAELWGNVFTSGSRMKVKCSTGITMQANDLPMVCDENGNWKNVPQCTSTPGLCSNPPSVTNADVLPGGTTIGDVRQYKCQPGTLLQPASGADVSTTCSPTKTWTSANFQCLKVCPDPPTVENAIITTGKNIIGESRSYSCTSYSKLQPLSEVKVGDIITTITCMTDSEWSKTNFKCVAECGEPVATTVKNAVIGPGLTGEGAERYYKCNQGFNTPQGSIYFTITCQSNGKWTDPTFSCARTGASDYQSLKSSFIFAFLLNNDYTYQRHVYVVSSYPAAVTITAPLQKDQYTYKKNITDGMQITLQANRRFSYINYGINQGGFHLEANASIGVYVESRKTPSSGGGVVIPERHLSTEYAILSWDESGYFTKKIAIIGTVDKTKVTTNLTGGLSLVRTLNRFEVFNYQSPGDISGTLISATQNIAVFAGQQCSIVLTTSTSHCDHVYEQMPPTRDLQKEFIVSFSYPRRDYALKIMAVVDNTFVTLSNGTEITLDRLEYTQFYFNNTPIAITSTHKIMVATFSFSRRDTLDESSEYFDPTMLIVPGILQFQPQYTMVVPEDVSNCSLMITYPSYLSAIDNFRLNHTRFVSDESAFVILSGHGNYTVLYKIMPKGTSVIYSTEGVPFGAYLSFFRVKAESWFSLPYKFT